MIKNTFLNILVIFDLSDILNIRIGLKKVSDTIADIRTALGVKYTIH